MRFIKILLGRYKELSIWSFFELLMEALFSNKKIFVYSCDLGTLNFHRKLPNIKGIIIKKGDFEELVMVKRSLMPLPWEFQCHEYDGVNNFFVGKDDYGIKHISWIYLYRNRNRILMLKKNEAEIKFCLTLPMARGRGLYPKVLQSILNYLHSEGFAKVYICAHSENFASIRGIEKAGFSKIGEIRMIKIMGVQISPRYRTKRRFYGTTCC